MNKTNRQQQVMKGFHILSMAVFGTKKKTTLNVTVEHLTKFSSDSTCGISKHCAVVSSQ